MLILNFYSTVKKKIFSGLAYTGRALRRSGYNKPGMVWQKEQINY